MVDDDVAEDEAQGIEIGSASRVDMAISAMIEIYNSYVLVNPTDTEARQTGIVEKALGKTHAMDIKQL